MSLGKNPIRIAVLLQDLEFGGTQRYAIHLLKHLSRDLFSPELWILRGGSDMVPAAEDAGIRITHLSHDTWVSPASLAALARKLVSSRPEILYTLTVVPNIWGRVFGRIARVPVVVSGYRNLFPKQYERWLWRLSDRIICNAEILKQIMVSRFSVDPLRIAVVPNAVDADFFRPDQSESHKLPTVLFVGRLVPEKAPLNLLEGFRLAAQAVPDATFEIIGNGPFKSQLQERIQEYGLGSRVKLLPAEADLRPAFRRASVFTLPSANEASPNVVIEAMAMGLPVVGTRVGGIPELIEDGRTGILVEPGSPQDLAHALTVLLTNEDQGREMGRAGRDRVLAYHSLKYMVSRTQEVLLEARRARN